LKQHSFSRVHASAGALILIAGAALTGCSGVVRNLNSAQVNTPSVNVANPLGLNGQTASVTVGGAQPGIQRAQVTVGNVNTFTFPNQKPVGLSEIKSAQLAFNLLPTVTLSAPTGQTTLPASFTLQTLAVNGTVSDTDGSGSGSSVTLTPLTMSAPVTFAQQKDGSYQASAGDIQLGQSQATTDQSLQTLLTIITGGPQPNTAALTLSATSANLPAGTTITFTFDTTALTVKAS